jgi:DNA repair protein RecO (recombination protein O)
MVKYREKSTAAGFVLGFIDYGEADRIVTFYTDKIGKLKGIAKGARRSKKRFSNSIELFSQSKIIFSRNNKEGLALIENCDVINHYPAIRENLESTMAASYLTDLTNRFTVEEKRNKELFGLIGNFLELIENGNDLEKIMRFFEIRLLELSGYDPVLEKCVGCGTPLDRINTPFFNSRNGGIECPQCHRNGPNAFPVSVGTVKTLMLGKSMEIDKIHRLEPSEKILAESGRILGDFIQYILGKELKSLRILNEIKKMMT